MADPTPRVLPAYSVRIDEALRFAAAARFTVCNPHGSMRDSESTGTGHV